jgi:hypothetical protein
LKAAGADDKMVTFVNGPAVTRGGLIMPSNIAFDNDAGSLVQKAKDCGAGALFLETMLEHIGDRESARQISTNNEFDVRRALAPMVAACREAELIGWGVMHPRKSMDGGIEDSISGSTAFRNVGRGVLHVYRDPTADDNEPYPTRLLVCSKANYLAKRPSTLRFRIEPWDKNPNEGRVVWGLEGKDLVDNRTAEDVWVEMAEARQHKRARNDMQAQKAEKLLLKVLADGKPHALAELEKACDEAGLSWSAMRRAKSNLGVRSHKAGFQGEGGWVMPSEEPTEDELM